MHTPGASIVFRTTGIMHMFLIRKMGIMILIISNRGENRVNTNIYIYMYTYIFIYSNPAVLAIS